MVYNLVPTKIQYFRCEGCDYITSRKGQYDRHLLTAKHQMFTNVDNLVPNTCDCGKVFKHRQSLSRHRRTCNASNNNSTNTNVQPNADNLIIQLLQEQKAMREENQEMREAMKEQQEQHHKQIQELIPKLQQVTTINNQTNNNTTNNNKFNLNFFLNEQCKDAISIQTFIENLDIGIKELEHMGNVGYLQGMMTIMSNTLGAMDVYKRPVHCTDLKRETVYIKDGDIWKKDNANNDDLRRVINTVANVNYRNLDVWESQHPDAFESDTPDNIEYCKIAMESLGGYDNSDDKIAIKLNKLVKHVVREVYVK